MMRFKWQLGGLIIWFLGTGFTAEAEPASLSSVSQPTPLINTAEGSVAAIHFKPQGATLTLALMSGNSFSLEFDGQLTTLWKGNERIELGALKLGDKVRIRYIEKDRKNLAKTIEVL